MSELSIELVKVKTKKGLVALMTRTAFLQLFVNGAIFLLTILLEPRIFGIFIVISSVVAFLRYVSDIGLAAALVQKKDDVTADDLKTTFTIQFILTIIFISIAYLLAPLVVKKYDLNEQGHILYLSLLGAFFFSSLKTIPSILLERKLEFNKFVIAEIVETVLFYLVVVVAAAKGLGVASFTIGVWVRSISGLIVMYTISPWLPRFGINKKSAVKLLSFGVPFQLNSFLALVKDDVLTMYLGATVGLTNLAYIGWAKKWSEAPLRLIMDNVAKVSFPAFSRLQDNKEVIRRATQKAVYFVCLFTIPLVGAMVLTIDTLVEIVPKYEKWQPALFSFYLFSGSVIFSSVSSLLTNIIQSLGKISIILRLMILWTVLTWILIPPFIVFFGYNGVAIASILIASTSIIPVLIARRLTSFSLSKAFLKPILISLISIAVMAVIRIIPLSPIYRLLSVLLFGGTVYLILLFRYSKQEILNFLKH